MTLWNPLHVFSAPSRRPEDHASSAFDPARTGDRPGTSPTAPAIGYGDVRVGTGPAGGEPARRPIGFAPPEDEPRFRTELSFKRHYESPRASAVPGDSEGTAGAEWQTPGVELPVAESHADEAQARSVAPIGDGSEETPAVEEAGDDVADVTETMDMVEPETEVASDPKEGIEEESVELKAVPFYKRELSLKRKRSTSDDGPEPQVVEAEPHQPAEQLGSHEGSEAPVEVVAVAEIQPEEDVDAGESDGSTDGDLDLVADSSDASSEVTAEEHVPFYKRELSFGRKTVKQEEIAVAVVASQVEPGDVVDEGVHADTETVASPNVEDELDADVIDVAPSDEMNEAEVASGAEESGGLADVVADAEVVADADAGADPDDTVESTDADATLEAGADLTASPSLVSEPAEGTSRRSRRSVRSSTRRQPSRSAKGNKIVGLKIGASQLAAAVVAESESGFELVQLARRPLETGIVVDGEVRDQDALTNALKAFFDEERLPKKGVRIGLGSNRIGVRKFDIVGIDDEARFDNAVRFKAHEVLPVAVHEAVLDYRVLEQRPNEDGEQMRRVLLVVAPQDQVDPYQLVADRVGLKLTGIDLEALALLRAFVEPNSAAGHLANDTATVVVAIGHESSTLLVAGGGACEFTRVFDWGGAALQHAIADSLQVMPAEASTMLRHLSLSGSGRKYDPLDDVARAQATEAVRLGLTPFTRELVNSLQFYQTQAESLGIGEIIVTGGTSHLEGLDQALHAMIGVAVSVGDPLARVNVTCDIDPAIQAAIGSMAVPIGLAISDGDARGVNLLRESGSTPRSKRSNMIAVALPLAAAVPLVALGLLYVGANGKVNDQQAQLDAVQTQLAALPKPEGPDIDAAVVGDEAVRATSVASVLGGRVAWDAVLRDLSRVLPANVWLTKLSLSQSQAGSAAAAAAAPPPAVPGQTAAPTAVTIDGYTYSQPDVARLLARLATLTSLRNVTLNSSQAEALGEREVTHFVIVADLTQTGGPS